jgi:hypothetical protein
MGYGQQVGAVISHVGEKSLICFTKFGMRAVWLLPEFTLLVQDVTVALDALVVRFCPIDHVRHG